MIKKIREELLRVRQEIFKRTGSAERPKLEVFISHKAFGKLLCEPDLYTIAKGYGGPVESFEGFPLYVFNNDTEFLIPEDFRVHEVRS